MKTDIIITELDYTRLCTIINISRQRQSTEFKNIEVLGSEIKRAKKIKSKKITPEFITMNSLIEVSDLETNRLMQLKLVYPGEADFKKGHISVLSPLGSALLGYKIGDTVSFAVPKGEKSVMINKILYQPEANGEFAV